MPTLHTRPLAPPIAAEAPAVPAAPGGRPRDPQRHPVEVRPSAIDGLGAFALAPIPARAKIGEVRGEPVSIAEAERRARAAERATGRIMMIAVSQRRAIDATHSQDPLRYANHSCAPNVVLRTEQGRAAFYALRDIDAGEELTLRYGETHHAGRLACRCGAPRCAGRL
ncbi:SET domain-containing protein [Caldimonas tepidiphila]|uniref:SET domain-containing protein n=1 Tax=Caldimonas tepidiphila TaxID=2315841 RepID=UPI001F0C398B|nr:SET domain-containing protein [Caldimonas tepidiphila]